MDEIVGVEFIMGRFLERGGVAGARGDAWCEPVHLVPSDLAPTMSGIADVDHDRSMYLVELALDFCWGSPRAGRRFPRQSVSRQELPAIHASAAKERKDGESAQTSGVVAAKFGTLSIVSGLSFMRNDVEDRASLVESRRPTEGIAQYFSVALPAYVVVVSIEGPTKIFA